ncbi:MAG: FAD-dependent oxidoreductase [Pseudomonadota bacterium]
MKEQAVVIVGGGQAALSAATKLRALGHSGSLDILSAEPVAPYQRPPLSKKYLLGEMTLERLLLKPPSFYEEAGIGLHLNEPVLSIDRQAQRVETAQRSLPYDALILATGSRPRRLPAAMGGDLPGVLTVRDLADIDAMAPLLVAGARALVVGGGYIGLEAAAVARKRGVAVTLIEMAPRILNRVAAPETADFFRDRHRAEGVDLREGVGLTRLEAGAPLDAVLSDGTTLSVDAVIVGIGIEPEATLATAAGLTIDNGIAVDAMGRTSDPAIWAAGDCASFPWRAHDGAKVRIRLESVQNAIEQAEHVAAGVMGEITPYAPLPWFWSDQYDVKLQIAGLNRGYDSVRLRPGTRPGGQSVWYFFAGRLVAVDAMNDPRAYMQGKRWLEAGADPEAGWFDV